MSEKWNKLPDEATIEKATQAVKNRGIEVIRVKDRTEAMQKIKEILPRGAELMTGGSTTLEEIGFTDLLKSGKHPYNNLKDKLFAEKDPQKQAELRRTSVTANYFLGSVHAISQNGEMVIASASGSQLPSYTFSSPNVIWIAGAQKITKNLDEAMQRVREYVLPLEDARMKKEGYPGSTIGKLLIFEREVMPRKITLILVKEKLGF